MPGKKKVFIHKKILPRLLGVARALVLGQEAELELEVLLDRDAVVLRTSGECEFRETGT